MRIVVSVVLLVVAAVLLYQGAQASDSIASSAERAVNGTPSDRTIWLYAGGAICGVLGMLGIVTRGPHSAG